jgi:DNA modification methylase
VFGTFHNTGLINRICQMKKYGIVNEIVWVQRNGRPNVATAGSRRRTRTFCGSPRMIGDTGSITDFASGATTMTGYRSEINSLRDVWDIPANSHENKACRHPSPKPLAVLARILDVAGRPGCLLLDLFSGSGTGAVAA